MSTPGSAGGPSPLRVGGLALLGVGAVAGLIGLAALATGNGGGSPTAAPAPSASVTGTAGPPAGATPTSEPPVSTSTAAVPSPSATATNGIVGPSGAPSAAPGAGSGSGSGSGDGSNGAGGGEVVRVPVRVFNNSPIKGLGERATEDIRNAGWPIDGPPGNWGDDPGELTIPTSTVYYRPGTDEQASARALGDRFGLRVEPRFAGIAGASAGLIVIVTNDYRDP